MSDNIANAINALANEHPNEFKDAINSELLSRLSSRIDLEKIQIAGQLFGTSAEEPADNQSTEEPADEN